MCVCVDHVIHRGLLFFVFKTHVCKSATTRHVCKRDTCGVSQYLSRARAGESMARTRWLFWYPSKVQVRGYDDDGFTEERRTVRRCALSSRVVWLEIVGSIFPVSCLDILDNLGCDLCVSILEMKVQNRELIPFCRTALARRRRSPSDHFVGHCCSFDGVVVRFAFFCPPLAPPRCPCLHHLMRLPNHHQVVVRLAPETAPRHYAIAEADESRRQLKFDFPVPPN